jgi:hypothetical protein
MRQMWNGMAAVALLATGSVAAPPGDPLVAAFQRPAPFVRPMVRWWWPGDAVTGAELRREIALFAASGFGGAEIQSFNPGIPNLTPAERAVIDDYAEPSFFAHVKTAASAARQNGLKLDYTFGSAWPSGGGAAIPPEKALLELAMASTAVDGGTAGPIKVAIPTRTKRLGAFNGFDPRSKTPEAIAWQKRFEDRAHIVSVVAMKGTAPALADAPKGGIQLSPWRDVQRSGELDPASRIDLTGKLAPDGTLDWTPPPGHWQVFVFKQYASNMGVLGSAGKGPQLVLNHYDRAAFEAHAARVGDPMVAALGPDKEAMRATFVDSLELFADLPWTEAFLAEFRARRGYDLTPWLPFLVQPGWMQAWQSHYSKPYYEAAGSEDAERVRADYRQTVSDLIIDNFVKPFVEWNHAHGLKAKFQAHGGPLDTLRGYGLADIPETEDLEGADPLFMRMARSAADIYGRPFVSAESLVWKDRPFSVTPDELRKRMDLIYSGGVTAETWHGYSYALHTDKWPGWYAFQPSAFAGGFSTMLDERNPIWAGVPRLAAYSARMNGVLRQGRGVVPVAMFYGKMGFYVGIEDDGAGAEAREKRLLAGGYDFDRINADALDKSRVEARQLVTPGGARFPVLVMPAIASLRAETAETIARFADQGLPVLFTGAMPGRETGWLDHAVRDARVKAAMARVARAGGRVVDEANLPAALAAAHVPANLRFDADASDVVFVERQVARRLVYFLFNHGETVRDASFVAPVRGGVERWDAMAGTRVPADATIAGSGTHVRLDLAPGEGALLVLDPALPERHPPVVRTVAEATLPSAGWQLAVEGHASGGVAVSRDVGEDVSLGDWDAVQGLADFAGVGTYVRTINVPAGWLASGRRVTLAMRGVHDMATVTVNGRKLEPLISSPWEIDISSALRAGDNRLAIAVANVPQNAMIDAKAPGFKQLKPVPAGLDGPVVLRVDAVMAQ